MTQKTIPNYQAARFPNKQVAGTVYDAVQELIYHDVECDLSAYRLKHKNTWHVVVIGEKPSNSLHVELEAQLTNGTLVTLDSYLLYELLARRLEASQLGPWVEGHYREDE
jgi:hypothetical protein